MDTARDSTSLLQMPLAAKRIGVLGGPEDENSENFVIAVPDLCRVVKGRVECVRWHFSHLVRSGHAVTGAKSAPQVPDTAVLC